jgi:hypothetical protein
MANDFEMRLGKLENRFDEYMAMFYRWLDELRVDHEESKKRIEQNEETMQRVIEIQGSQGMIISQLVDTQGSILQLIDRMERKLDRNDQKLDLMDQKIDSLLNRGTNGKH